MAQLETSAGAPPDKRRTIITLQWLVTIVSSGLMLFSKGVIVEDFRSYGLVVLFLASTLLFYRLPDSVFQHRYFDMTLLVADTVLISAAIYQNQGAPWDLFLLYFFILFLSAVGESLTRIVLGFFVVSLLYVGLVFHQGKGLSAIGPDFFLRVAFLFGISILYGYLSESAKKEKTRAETAEQKERLKMDLVAALAHDMKTPLGIVMNYAETMTEQLAGRPEEKTRLEFLERIQENARRIVNLVTGFLEASKAEAGKLEISRAPVALNGLLQTVARHQQSDLEKKGLALELRLDEALPAVLGDEKQLERVFWNLIGNAVKFTPAGGKITVSSSPDGGHVRVSIQDTGKGIPKEELPLLFAQFRRLKSSAGIEGTGLGLFIVKTIVEAHKGTVQAESGDGQGSTFIVRLPIGG